MKEKHEQNKERNRSYEEPDGILELKIQYLKWKKKINTEDTKEDLRWRRIINQEVRWVEVIHYE